MSYKFHGIIKRKYIAFAMYLFCVLVFTQCADKKKESSALKNGESDIESLIESDTTFHTYKQQDINWEDEAQKEKEHFYTLPLISEESLRELALKIQKWSDYYQLDLSRMRMVNQDTFRLESEIDTTSLYFREFTVKDDSPSLKTMDYSPNKQRYVSLGLNYVLWEKDGKLYYNGWDDCQEIYLIDRKFKRWDMILWFGASTFGEAVFWINNDTFVIVGHNDVFMPMHFIYQFDLANSTTTSYEMPVGEIYSGYMDEINIKERGEVIRDEFPE